MGTQKQQHNNIPVNNRTIGDKKDHQPNKPIDCGGGEETFP